VNLSLPDSEYLLEASKTSLQKMYLAALDQEAQHTKQVKMEEAEARKYAAMAEALRWLIDFRDATLEAMRKSIEMQPELKFPELPERTSEEPTPSWRPRYAGAPTTAKRRTA
jgi:hypothetical protein